MADFTSGEGALICIPTYNEKENIAEIVPAVGLDDAVHVSRRMEPRPQADNERCVSDVGAGVYLGQDCVHKDVWSDRASALAGGIDQHGDNALLPGFGRLFGIVDPLGPQPFDRTHAVMNNLAKAYRASDGERLVDFGQQESREAGAVKARSDSRGHLTGSSDDDL